MRKKTVSFPAKSTDRFPYANLEIFMTIKHFICNALGWVGDFFSLIFPHLCTTCNQTLVEGEKHLCYPCLTKMPFTGYAMHRENPVTEIFWGRILIETGTSLLHFQKGSIVQRLIHAFKYQGNLKLGLLLGEMLGQTLSSSPHYNTIDAIIPVPLHPSRLKERGFNQSEIIARGVSRAINKPVQAQWLMRNLATQTQTRHQRWARWGNVADAFEAKPAVAGKNIILIDDVITTGATLEACAIKLSKSGTGKLWLASLALTQ